MDRHMERKILSFSQSDYEWQNGSTACCPISLMLSIYVGICKNTYKTADELFRDSVVFSNAVKYGSMLWRIGVLAERALCIKDVMLNAISVRSGECIIRNDMKQDDYAIASIDELLVRCLEGVCVSPPQEPSTLDIGIQIPGYKRIFSHMQQQELCTLVKQSFLLKDLVGVDDHDDSIEFTLDYNYSQLKQKYRLLENILHCHPDSIPCLSRLEEYILKMEYGRCDSKMNFEGALYKIANPEFWYLYCCPLDLLYEFEYHLYGETEDFNVEIVGAAIDCVPDIRPIIGKAINRYKNEDNANGNDLLFLASALDYLIPTPMGILPAPMESQLKPKAYAILLRLRANIYFADELKVNKGKRLLRRWNGQVDPVHISHLLSREGSYVLTGVSSSSISVHVFESEVHGLEYVVYDSHSLPTSASAGGMGSGGGSRVTKCHTIPPLIDSITEGIHSSRGTAYKLRLLPHSDNALECTTKEIETFLEWNERR